jgi:hypothetical protein
MPKSADSSPASRGPARRPWHPLLAVWLGLGPIALALHLDDDGAFPLAVHMAVFLAWTGGAGIATMLWLKPSRGEILLGVCGALTAWIALIEGGEVVRRQLIAYHLPEFESVARDAVSGRLPKCNGRPFGKVGGRRVQEIRVDPRGGVYFAFSIQSSATDDWIDGLVWQPNPKGSPFGYGDTYYKLSRLRGEWHLFSDFKP